MTEIKPRSEIVKQDFCIQPENIDTDKHFYRAFGNNETEISAHWIVKFCQKRGKWEAFSKEQIEEIYNEKGYHSFTFNRLIEPELVRNNPWSDFHLEGGGWIIEYQGLYHITKDFVVRCFAAAPK